MLPEFRNGYNKYLDLTEEEYWDKHFEDYGDEPMPQAVIDSLEAPLSPIEGEPWEDMYFHGIPDYDQFGRPSWGTDELED